MMNREEREARSAFWMQDLRECSSAGERLSNYALRHGLNIGEGYQWTRVLPRALQPKSKTAATCSTRSYSNCSSILRCA
jgi:hypothetical protein